MSTKQPPVPRPSASILLLSHRNDILLLHRVQTSSAFPSAHVFPGGNLAAEQDGPIPSPDDSMRHEDSPVYRIGAIRECFEESGILLARPKGVRDRLLELSDEARESGRKAIHANKKKFQEWVESNGGELDIDGLVPFTRWVTPPGPPKRFTTQMYLYFLPLNDATTTGGSTESTDTVIQSPTHDGGLEHTEARFLSVEKWLEMAGTGEVILFPPQYFLVYLLNRCFKAGGIADPTDAESGKGSSSNAELQKQRERVLEFVETGYPAWTKKCISPTMLLKLDDGRQVLSLESPGPELKGSSRQGESDHVVLVEFKKEGPRRIEIRQRSEIVTEARKHLRASQRGVKI